MFKHNNTAEHNLCSARGQRVGKNLYRLQDIPLEPIALTQTAADIIVDLSTSCGLDFLRFTAATIHVLLFHGAAVVVHHVASGKRDGVAAHDLRLKKGDAVAVVGSTLYLCTRLRCQLPPSASSRLPLTSNQLYKVNHASIQSEFTKAGD